MENPYQPFFRISLQKLQSLYTLIAVVRVAEFKACYLNFSYRRRKRLAEEKMCDNLSYDGYCISDASDAELNDIINSGGMWLFHTLKRFQQFTSKPHEVVTFAINQLIM
jgi:hypothetical protein